MFRTPWKPDQLSVFLSVSPATWTPSLIPQGLSLRIPITLKPGLTPRCVSGCVLRTLNTSMCFSSYPHHLETWPYMYLVCFWFCHRHLEHLIWHPSVFLFVSHAPWTPGLTSTSLCFWLCPQHLEHLIWRPSVFLFVSHPTWTPGLTSTWLCFRLCPQHPEHLVWHLSVFLFVSHPTWTPGLSST